MIAKIISRFLALAFILSGCFMVTPSLSPKVHDDMKKEFEKMLPINPLIEYGIMNYDAKTYRLVVGTTEIICGFIILIGPSLILIHLAYTVLTFVMVGALYSHYRVRDELGKYVPAAVLLTFLVLRLIGVGNAKDEQQAQKKGN